MLFRSIDFLGFHVSPAGLQLPENKKSQIDDYPQPTNSQALRRFLGMVGFYRRLISDFANIIFHLTELAKHNPKNKFLPWTELEEEAFKNIKSAITRSTALPFARPDVSHLQLVTDSSQVAVGAALHQMINGEAIPIDFFSKKLSETQTRYSTFDRELLAAYLAVLRDRKSVV